MSNQNEHTLRYSMFGTFLLILTCGLTGRIHEEGGQTKSILTCLLKWIAGTIIPRRFRATCQWVQFTSLSRDPALNFRSPRYIYSLKETNGIRSATHSQSGSCMSSTFGVPSQALLATFLQTDQNRPLQKPVGRA
jgi:hypothetical protein